MKRKREKTFVEKTRDAIMRRLIRLAHYYIKARYPEGAKDECIYLSVAIIKDAGDTKFSVMFNNECYKEVGDGNDVSFPFDEHERVSLKEND